MREIKFRAKDKKGHWHYGFLDYRDTSFWIHEVYDTPPTMSDPGGSLHSEYVLIDHETIGQYTGLKDRFQVDIYEGDNVCGIVCFSGDYDSTDIQHSGTVKYDSEYVSFTVPSTYSGDVKTPLENYCNFLHQFDIDTVFIEGNIHDNVETK